MGKIEKIMSENDTGREFVGEESLEGTDEIDGHTNSHDNSYREFLGEVSLKRSHGMNEDTMSEKSSSRELLREEKPWGAEQEWSEKSSTGSRKQPEYSSDISGEKEMSKHPSSTSLRQSWTNDMQLVSMYLDEKVSQSLDVIEYSFSNRYSMVQARKDYSEKKLFSHST